MTYRGQQICFCTTADGVRIAYATTGKGPPLVMIATWLRHLEFDWESPVWRHWLAALSTHNTLIRYDNRGCGLSDSDVQGFSLDAWVQDLETVVDQLGLDKFVLLGISRGGAVSATYAARHPDRLNHLILYGSFAQGRFKRDLTPQKREEAEMLVKLTQIGWGQDNPAFRQVFTTLFMPEATTEQMRWFNDLQRMSMSPENAFKSMVASYNLDVTTSAARVTTPTLVLHSRQDAVVPFAQGRELAALIPNARFVPLESKNHILMHDEPAWQVLLTEVYRFIGVEPAALEHVPDELTRREREIAGLVALGKSNREIAGELVVSERTVEGHVSNVLAKLGLRSRTQLSAWAVERGLAKVG